MTSPGDRTPLPVRVTEARAEAECVRSLVLRRTSGAALPAWEPGAHIDLLLPDGSARQYSLCGDPADLGSYRIAILREPEGRGGSRWIHDDLIVGDVLRLRPPRNHFTLENATGYTFLAGGIGITPILPMVKKATHRGIPWQLVYGGRSRTSMAFLPELEEASGMVQVIAEDASGRPDIDAVLGRVHDDELIYVCGPAGLIDAVKAIADTAGLSESLRFELFAAPVVDDVTQELAPPFEVELARSGLVVKVSPTSSILETVWAAGVDVISDCQDGICGSCETAILQGRADHRDHVLTEEEQRQNTCMMICVSRSLDNRLVLDL